MAHGTIWLVLIILTLIDLKYQKLYFIQTFSLDKNSEDTYVWIYVGVIKQDNGRYEHAIKTKCNLYGTTSAAKKWY